MLQCAVVFLIFSGFYKNGNFRSEIYLDPKLKIDKKNPHY